jgi:hypothetical protein
MRIRTTSVALASVALALAGCSSSGSGSTTPSAPAAATSGQPAPTQAADDGHTALTAAVRAYIAAFFKPDAAATFDLLSARCQKDTSVTEMKQELAASALVYGKPAVKSIEVNQLAAPLARVTVHYVTPPMPEKPQSWTREGGQWRYDAC